MNCSIEEHHRRAHEACDRTYCCHNITPRSSKRPPLDLKYRPLELYTQMFHACFLPATCETLQLRTGELRNRRLSMTECFRKRAMLQVPMTDLCAAMKGPRTMKSLEYILEYGLRLYSGIDKNVPMDHCFALRLFSEVADFCSCKYIRHAAHKYTIIAANCYIYIIMLQQRHTEDQVPTLLCSCEFVQQATIYLVQSYGHGMFTYSSLWLWLWMSSPKRKGLCRDIPDIAMELFEDEWDIFLEETGVQPLGTTCCAYCEREGVRHPDKKSDDKVRTLKQCAGDCMRDKKPLYCSQWCQAMDWEQHRRWCKSPENRPRLFVEEEFF